MLFAPEIQEQQAQHEKDLKEARSFFENMPENGIVIHGGLSEFAEIKKHNGLKKYKDIYYFYIPNPGIIAPEKDLITAHKSAIKAIDQVIHIYSFGATSQIYTDRISNFNGNDYSPKEFYKNHPELEPSLLCFEAPGNIKNVVKKDSSYIGLAHPVAAKDCPVDSNNFLFETKLNYSELSQTDIQAISAEKLVDKTLKRIRSGWTKDKLEKSSSFLERNAKFLEVSDIVNEMVSRSHRNPVYAEAISRAKNLGIDLQRYQEVGKWVTEDQKLISKEELASAKNPMAIFELTRRIDQVKSNLNLYSRDEVRNKILRMIGVGEPSLFKREKTIIEVIYIATKLKLKYGNSFVGLVAYGSQMDRYKPDSSELDVRVIIKPSAEDISKPYTNEQNILNDIEDFALKRGYIECKPTIIYYDDLTSADLEPQGQSAQSILEVNNAIDHRSAPIIFGRKDRKLFNALFRDNLKHIQTQ